MGALSYPQRPQHSKRAGARGVQVRAHVVLQAVQRDDVGITRDTNLSACALYTSDAADEYSG